MKSPVDCVSTSVSNPASLYSSTVLLVTPSTSETNPFVVLIVVSVLLSKLGATDEAGLSDPFVATGKALDLTSSSNHVDSFLVNHSVTA